MFARLFDSHVHLDSIPDADAGIARLGAGYRALNPGIEPAGTRSALERGRLGVRHAAAVHPWFIGDLPVLADDRMEAVEALVEQPHVVAIGETGLDHVRHSTTEQREAARRWFEAHVALAVRVGLPLVVHCVRAHDDCLGVLRGGGASRVGGVIHAFSGSPEVAAAYTAMGFRVGIGCAVTRERSSRVRRIAAEIDGEHLLVETDAPSMRVTPEGNPVEDILAVIEEVARLRGVAPPEIAELTAQNATDLFGAW